MAFEEFSLLPPRIHTLTSHFSDRGSCLGDNRLQVKTLRLQREGDRVVAPAAGLRPAAFNEIKAIASAGS
ncbi:hypothetical protein PGT21_021257 [Puccinia graminis f. sp. tritici]|uniref:Uncharacterized protein n=1 Tax=Puccinia graminis f. sp. tritici TaxID=56615 RepID=A0A5B0NWV4_PUCGR|nr:hypothetical protein PGT21_021257 [Puccinia graminis f. sp. tritici]